VISRLFVTRKLFLLLDNSSKDTTILTKSKKSSFTFNFSFAYLHHPRSGAEFYNVYKEREG